MNLPQFSAEASLGPTLGIYRGKAVFARSGMGEVLPMAPCCDMTDLKSLKVTFPYTKCGPLRDFIAPITDFIYLVGGDGAGQSVAKGTESARFIANQRNTLPKTILDQQVCMTSRGPWNATLIETRACSGYGPTQSLVIDAFGDKVSFDWQGGVELHPPNVGLVSCRQVHTLRFPCSGGLSTCDCQSYFCPATETCTCNLEGIW